MAGNRDNRRGSLSFQAGPASVTANSGERVEARGAPGRADARGNRHDNKQHDDRDERERIVGARLYEERGEHAAERECRRESDRHADCQVDERSFQKKPDHLPRLRSDLLHRSYDSLADHVRAGTFGVLSGSAFGEPSTRDAAACLEAWGKERPVVLVVSEDDENVFKSFRNLDRVLTVTADELEVAEVVWARALLVTETCLDALQRRAS